MKSWLPGQKESRKIGETFYAIRTIQSIKRTAAASYG